MLLQFIPARGRKPRDGIGNSRFDLVAIYPREGTETRRKNWSGPLLRCCNLSPRGDGNKNQHFGHCISGRCNSSPRGDGNPRELWYTVFRGGLQFIPARGRKRSRSRTQCHKEQVAIHPREGTETENNCSGHDDSGRCNSSPRGDGNTLSRISAARSLWRCNSSPRGDGNSNMLTHMRLMPRLQFIPVRGRKLLRAGGELGVQLLQFIPARGQKLVLYDEL